MLNPKTKDKMNKAAEGGEREVPVENKAVEAAEAVPAWAQALLEKVTSLEAELATAREVQAGMSEVIATQELTLQQHGNALIPVAPTQPMKLREPVSRETPHGNVRTDR